MGELAYDYENITKYCSLLELHVVNCSSCNRIA